MTNTWGTTRTGMVYHSFNEEGQAICRNNIRRPEGVDSLTETQVDARLAEAWGARVRGFRKCESCTQMEAAFRDRLEASMAPSTGEGDYLPPSEDVAPVQDPQTAPVGTSVTVTHPGRPPFPGTVAHIYTLPGHVAVRDPQGIVQTHPASFVTVNPPTTSPEEKEDDMSPQRNRVITGPLNQRQIDVLDRIAQGMTHQEAADDLGVSRVCVSDNMGVAVAKMGAENSWGAVARWMRRQAFLDAADMIARFQVKEPSDDTEHHVNHVMGSLIGMLRDRAQRLTPS